jgi:hypothetical protein
VPPGFGLGNSPGSAELIRLGVVREALKVKQHRWIVAVIYQLSEDEAEQVERGTIVNLDHGHRIGVDGPGCLDCQLLYEDARGTLCDAAEVKGDT